MTAIYVTACAGIQQRNAPRLVHQASKTIKTGMRIMRQFAPVYIQRYQTAGTCALPELLLLAWTLNCYQVLLCFASENAEALRD